MLIATTPVLTPIAPPVPHWLPGRDGRTLSHGLAQGDDAIGRSGDHFSPSTGSTELPLIFRSKPKRIIRRCRYSGSVSKEGDMTAQLDLERWLRGRRFLTILADPPWRFQNSTGKIAPEHRRLSRYGTMKLNDIKALPVDNAAEETAHLYLWVPNALLPEGLEV